MRWPICQTLTAPPPTLCRREQNGLQQEAICPTHGARQAAYHLRHHLPRVQCHGHHPPARAPLQLPSKQHLKWRGGEDKG